MQNVLVIGAAGGVGSAVIKLLLTQNNTVHGTVLNAQEKQLAQAHSPDIASLHLLDLSLPENVLTELTSIGSSIGAIDSVVVCGAISPYGPLETASLSTARKTFEINSLSNLAVYQAVMPALRASQGRLLMISSMAGRAAMPFVGVYSASKFALEGLADVMRREAKPQGVDVILVEPGGIKTGMVDNQLEGVVGAIAALTEEQDKRYGYLYRQFQALASHSHTGDASTPEAVAEVIVSALAEPSPQARYIAGDDAKALLNLADELPDEGLDQAFAGMFTGAMGDS